MVLFTDKVNSVIFVISFGGKASVVVKDDAEAKENANKNKVHYYYKEFKGLLKNIFVMDQFKANIVYNDEAKKDMSNKYFV